MTTDSAPSSLRIVLNVGGVRFETTRQTIEKSLMLIGLVDTVRAGFSASSPPAQPTTQSLRPAPACLPGAVGRRASCSRSGALPRP